MVEAAPAPDARAAWVERGWLLLALVAVLLAFSDLVFFGRALVGFDHAIEYLPTWSFERASLLRGELPLWDPRAGAGTPLLAALYGGALDPVRWLFFPLPEVQGYTLHVVALHLLAAAGAFRLARALGARPWIAAFAAVLLGGGGPLRSLGGFEKELASAAWVPWVLLGAVRFGRRPSLEGALALAGLLALTLLAGGPEYALAGGALVSGAAVWAGVSVPPGQRRRATAVALALAALAGGVALVLSLGALVPALELSRISTRRAGVEWAQVAAHATHPLQLLTLLLPGLFGNSAAGPRPLGAALFDQSYFLPLLYPGALAVLLLPLAPLRASRAARGLALVLVLATLFTLGERGFLFTLVMKSAPPLQVFRYPYKAWSYAAPALAVLAALGLERLVAEGAPLWARRPLLYTAALSIGLAGLGFAALRHPSWRSVSQRLLLGPQPPTLARLDAAGVGEAAGVLFARGAVLAALAFALGVASERGRLGGRERARALGGLALLSLLELLVTARSATPTVPADFYAQQPFLARFFEGEPRPRFYPASRDDRLPTAFERSYGTATFEQGGEELHQSYWEYDRERLRDNLATFYGLPQLHDYNPGRLAWANRLYAAVEGVPREERARVLAALGAELVVSPAALENPDLSLVGKSPRPLPQCLYRVRDALPRAQVLRHVERLATHQACLERLVDPGSPVSRTLLLRGDGAPVEPEDWRPIEGPLVLGSLGLDPRTAARVPPALDPGPATARIVRLEPRHVEVELLAPAPADGWLLLRDAFEPRWRASVDGAPAPLVRADFFFRAVPLVAGARTVVFDYDASLAREAFGASLAGWLVWAAVLVLRRSGRLRFGGAFA